MELIELSWLAGEASLKDALQTILGASGQLVKKYFSSKEQNRTVKPREVLKLPLNFVNHQKLNPRYTGPDIRIISEDNDFLVIHKPPGVHCHPHSYEDTGTLLNFLVSKNIWAPLLVNESQYDRGLLYRLDYETSGVIVFAKTERFFRFMRENFDSAMKRKFYWAVVEGEFTQEGLWTHHLKGTGLKGVKQKVHDYGVPESREGTLAVMKVTSHMGKSLVLVKLKTGLRHQIRAQLSHLGYPILGDELYGGRQADRLFLHALRYEFSQTVEDPGAELFNVFFDLNGALQMSHDMLGRF